MLMKTGVCEDCSIHTEPFRHDSQVKAWMERHGWGIHMFPGEILDKALLYCPKCEAKVNAEFKRCEEANGS